MNPIDRDRTQPRKADMTSTDTTENTATDDRDLVAYAADVVAYRTARSEHEEIDILLIQRRYEPFVGQWALPGGHVDADETAEEAALRELGEETGIDLTHHWEGSLDFVGLFDRPDRDPRGRVVSAAYVVELNETAEPVAGDDAAAAKWVGLSEAFATGLAFDHDEVIRAALAKAFVAPAAHGEASAAEVEDELEVSDPDPEMAVRIVYSGGDDETLWRMSEEEIAELTDAFAAGRPFSRRWRQTTQVFLPAQVTRLYIYDANND